MGSDHSVRTMRCTVQSPVGQLLEGVAGLNGVYNEYFFFTGPKYGVSLYAIFVDLFVLIAINPGWTGHCVHDTSHGTSRLAAFHVSWYSTPHGDPCLMKIKISTGIF